MYYHIIKTGKHGNCVIINDVMVDCGVSFSDIRPYLGRIKYLIITHTHKDHVDRETLETIKRVRPDIFIIGNGTVDQHYGVSPRGLITYNVPIYTADYQFTPFRLNHDVENTGYVWSYEGQNIIFAVDTGDLTHAPQRIKYDYFFLECGFDEELLRESDERMLRHVLLPYKQFSRHLSRQCAEVFFQLHKRDDAAVLIELHPSELMYGEEKEPELTDENKVTPGMQQIYLAYPVHSSEQYKAAAAFVRQIRSVGHKVYWATDNPVDGVLDGVSLRARDFQFDIDAMKCADIVLVCADGNDFTGVEFDLTYAIAMKEMAEQSPALFVCDLKYITLHPLGEHYVGSRIERTATIGGVEAHGHRVASTEHMLNHLKDMIRSAAVSA